MLSSSYFVFRSDFSRVYFDARDDVVDESSESFPRVGLSFLFDSIVAAFVAIFAKVFAAIALVWILYATFVSLKRL